MSSALNPALPAGGVTCRRVAAVVGAVFALCLQACFAPFVVEDDDTPSSQPPVAGMETPMQPVMPSMSSMSSGSDDGTSAAPAMAVTNGNIPVVDRPEDGNYNNQDTIEGILVGGVRGGQAMRVDPAKVTADSNFPKLTAGPVFISRYGMLDLQLIVPITNDSTFLICNVSTTFDVRTKEGVAVSDGIPAVFVGSVAGSSKRWSDDCLGPGEIGYFVDMETISDIFHLSRQGLDLDSAFAQIDTVTFTLDADAGMDLVRPAARVVPTDFREVDQSGDTRDYNVTLENMGQVEVVLDYGPVVVGLDDEGVPLGVARMTVGLLAGAEVERLPPGEKISLVGSATLPAGITQVRIYVPLTSPNS